MGFAVAELPVEQRTVEGRKGILNERVQQAVAMLASDTSTPRGSLTDLGVDHMLITFTDLRVYELIKHAMSSEQARKEVIDEILPVIRDYSSRADPNTILGQESFVKGWRSGYDSLLAILAAIDYTDAFPLVLKCFELHQAEIDNPVPQVYQEHGDWMPHGYGHNNYFSIYIDVALKHCAGDESIPPAARAIAAEHVSERKKVRTSTYKCAGHEISFPNPTNHHADPLRCALQFKRAMRDAGLWEDLTSSPD